MVAFPPLLARDSVGLLHTNLTYPPPAPPTFTVICAYPLSGQYGPGTRYLYYGLVAVSIFAQRQEWLRELCLAAALLFPTLASIHVIIMACYSESELVDLDIYGVLVVIAVATLAMPLTLRFSRTYFDTPGRNLVFLCALLNLAGLVSLSVAFFRAKSHTCIGDDGQPIHDASGGVGLCQFNCALFPDTPIRAGSNSGMQLGFAPRTGVTLNTGIVLSIAFCLLAFLSIVTMWNQVILDNAQQLGLIPDASSILPRRNGEGKKSGVVRGLLNWMSHPPDNMISGETVKLGLRLIELLVYSGAMLATIIISEVTFWSVEMRVGVEPMTAVGQWSPIVGATIASLAALYRASNTPAARARAGSLIDSNHERCNSRGYSQGRYRTYPKTPGEDLLNPKLAEHEKKFYQARAGHSRSQTDLVAPGSPNGRDSNAGASTSGSQTLVGGSQISKPDKRPHARTGSSGSQFLEVPRPFPPIAAVVTDTIDTEQQPSSKPSSG